ncbi:hypothetical protein FRB95_014241, partial [Tulasnella sp. JGI-2019a]
MCLNDLYFTPYTPINNTSQHVISTSCPMSFDAASSEKIPQMPIPNRYDPNQSSIHELRSNAVQPSGEDHPLLFDAVPNGLPLERTPVFAPFISIFLFGSIGIFSVQRLDHLLAKGNEQEWDHFRDAVVTRVNNLNVIASLFITGAAVFLSTMSPDPRLSDWGSDLCFYAFGGTVGVSMLAILVGCIISYVFMDLRTADLR